MIFSTYTFIFLFFPITFILYTTFLRLRLVNGAKISLIVASFVFYAYGSGSFFPVFVASVFLNYGFGLALARTHEKASVLQRRGILFLGLTGNIALLCIYKYTDFLIANFNFFLNSNVPLQHIILPIGISFFTFQLIAYLVDSYRGQTANYNLLDYLLFITFFPQLIVGPIVHHKDVVPQYNRLNLSWLTAENFSRGLFLFSIGCCKKLLLADPLTEWSQRAYDNAQSLNMIESWSASLGFTMSYYFDLSGYADMAIGLGIMFGVTLPINFNSPYKATNFADYWRRWHMSLSRFLGDYIFRNVYKKGMSETMFYVAVMVTFFVSGIWHGAGWTFVVWGVVNGVFVCMAHASARSGWKMPFLVAWGLTFLGVVGTRILFVSDSFDDALHVYSQLFNIAGFYWAGSTYVSIRMLLYIAVSFVIVLALPNSMEILEKFKVNATYLMATIVLIVLSLLNMSYVRGFLYFQF